MLWYMQRKKLEKLFVEWAEKNQAAQSPFNMVTCLMGKDLLDIDAALTLIESENGGSACLEWRPGSV